MSKRVLDKVYNPTEVENKWYAFWTENDYFKADPESEKPSYVIMIPPPNVTGMLTMGHILNNTVQDLLIRWKHMEGCETLWMPGTDHAGIATQNKVEAALREEGKTRYDLGRDKLVERVWEWKEMYGGIILKQLRKLGASCDWSRERFTMDEGLSNAVKEVFIRLYDKGLIYRGRRLINWCPRCHTALADEEAPNKDINGKFWHLAYPLESGRGEIVVSTTRPETMLGDTGVAVNPEDPKYKDLVGEYVILPLMNRRIPIVADEHADPEKGSGAVKITPAHDFDDFMVGQRQGLEQIQIMDESGVMNENAGKYKGLDRFAARKAILEDLEALGLLRGDEPRITPIPHCYRCDTVVEPYLSEQWFVKMQPLAEPAIKAVREGKIRFYPKHWEETYFHWMENIQDWCISRQIWWGHRIPVWTCENGHMFTSRENPAECPECQNTNLTQDPDVLDTWFSSWLWPFSTLGWPEETPDLKAFYPTNSLVTGPDIIFFWVARMIMAGLEFMGDVPFTDVYFNGMIRDLKGRKMSKSLGNSPDPLWLIDGADKETAKAFAKHNASYSQGVPAYGADAIRMTMVHQTPLGGDIHFDHPLVEMGQKFCNKLWNASRFVMMNLEGASETDFNSLDKKLLAPEDRWILSRLQKTIQQVCQTLETFYFNETAHILYGFIWGEFCDWYLELIKPRLYSDDVQIKQTAQTVLSHVLEQTLLLLHPLMPFITEEIWQALTDADLKTSILDQAYPKAEASLIDETAEKDLAFLQAVIGGVRNIRGEMNVPPERKAKLFIHGPSDKIEQVRSFAIPLERLAGIESIEAMTDTKPKDSATTLVEDLELCVPLTGLIDIAVEKERIRKELERLSGMVTGLEKKLGNEEFVSKAPAQVVEKEQQKLKDMSEKVEKLEKSLKMLG